MAHNTRKMPQLPVDLSIIRANENAFIEIPLPGSRNILTKIIKVDRVNLQAVMQVRFLPGGRAPRHLHHCRAIAYTLSGEWQYDDGKFGPGDVAYEVPGNEHTPSSVKGGEMVLIMTSPDGRFLDNYMPDGSIIRHSFKTFEFFKGKTQAEVERLNLSQLAQSIDIIPAPGADVRWLYRYIQDCLARPEAVGLD
ncbi:MAG: hypothetical protein RLZ98_137 [Pseudomonadota bacterium]|jgi:quercetin dioxygenase-like cupin family protein